MSNSTHLPPATVKTIMLNAHSPEYLARPEFAISALLSLCYEFKYLSEWEESAGNKKLAVIYEKLDDKDPPNKIHFEISFPFTKDSNYPDNGDGFASSLSEGGIRADNKQDVAKAITQSLMSGKPRGSGRRIALPLTPALSGLTNIVGAAGKERPFNYAHALQASYIWGCNSDSIPAEELSLAEKVNNALERYMKEDPWLRTIDTSIKTELLQSMEKQDEISRTLSDCDPGGVNAEMRRLSGGTQLFKYNTHETPFTWMKKNLDLLTSPTWTEVLPVRRWCDWVSTVLRYGFAFGQLWTVTFYTLLAEKVIGDPNEARSTTVESLLEEMAHTKLLHWKPSDETVTKRDVASTLACKVGPYAKLVDEFRSKMCAKPDMEIGAFLGLLAEDDEFVFSISDILNNGKSKSALEFVNYTLLKQETTGESADLYGLLEKHGRRYTVVTPGIEVVALFASLSAGKPGQVTILRDVIKSFTDLGMQPPEDDLLLLLTQAGLTSGAPDAEDAVIIESAF